MKIVLASHNQKKLAELSEILSQVIPDVQLVTPHDVGIYAEVEETGSTFLENATLKAKFIAQSGYVAIADDSGLCVDALDGKPGVHSARYSGGNDQDNIDLLLQNLSDVPMPDRTAYFACCMVCAVPGHDACLSVQDVCRGTVLTARQGEGGFGYDPIFFSHDLHKSLGEASAEEKNKISHRGRASRRLAQLLPDFLAGKVQ